MSLRQYEDFVFRAGLLHLDDPVAAWKELSVRQQMSRRLPKRERRNPVRHSSRYRSHPGSRPTIMAKQRWQKNFPDGEVFTGPIESATQGVVCYSFPAVHGGRESDGIELTFEDGKVVNAKASKGEQFLFDMLDQIRSPHRERLPLARITPLPSTLKTHCSMKKSVGHSMPPWEHPIQRRWP